MFSIDQAEEDFATVLKQFSGQDIFISEPNFVRPSTAHTTVKLFNISEIGGTDRIVGKDTAPDALDAEVDRIRHLTLEFEIQTYYRGARQATYNLKRLLSSELMGEDMMNADLGYTSSTQVVNFTQEVNGTFEERSAFSVFMDTTTTDSTLIPLIKLVEIRGNTIDANNQTITDDTVVVGGEELIAALELIEIANALHSFLNSDLVSDSSWTVTT